MERAQVLVIAVVVAALTLFGLRFFSDAPGDSDLVGGGRGVGDIALAPRCGGDQGERGSTSGRAGAARPGSRPHGPGGDGGRGGSFGRGDGGGSAGAGGGARLLPGMPRGGGSVGSATGGGGGAGASGGSGNTVALGGDSGGRLGPRAALKDDLVETLSSRPTTADELRPPEGDTALTVSKPDDIPDQAGRAEDVVEPEEGGDGVKITDRGRVEFPNAGNASGDAGTISFQIKPDWRGSDQTDNALVQIRQEHQWNNRLELVKNGEFLRFIITDDTGKETDISARISNWDEGEVHDIQASWGEGKTYLYIDGEVAGSNTYPGELRFSDGTPMFLGADHRGSNYNGANATLYDFTVTHVPSHPLR